MADGKLCEGEWQDGDEEDIEIVDGEIDSHDPMSAPYPLSGGLGNDTLFGGARVDEWDDDRSEIAA